MGCLRRLRGVAGRTKQSISALEQVLGRHGFHNLRTLKCLGIEDVVADEDSVADSIVLEVQR